MSASAPLAERAALSKARRNLIGVEGAVVLVARVVPHTLARRKVEVVNL